MPEKVKLDDVILALLTGRDKFAKTVLGKASLESTCDVTGLTHFATLYLAIANKHETDNVSRKITKNIKNAAHHHACLAGERRLASAPHHYHYDGGDGSKSGNDILCHQRSCCIL